MLELNNQIYLVLFILFFINITIFLKLKKKELFLKVSSIVCMIVSLIFSFKIKSEIMCILSGLAVIPIFNIGYSTKESKTIVLLPLVLIFLFGLYSANTFIDLFSVYNFLVLSSCGIFAYASLDLGLKSMYYYLLTILLLLLSSLFLYLSTGNLNLFLEGNINSTYFSIAATLISIVIMLFIGVFPFHFLEKLKLKKLQKRALSLFYGLSYIGVNYFFIRLFQDIFVNTTEYFKLYFKIFILLIVAINTLYMIILITKRRFLSELRPQLFLSLSGFLLISLLLEKVGGIDYNLLCRLMSYSFLVILWPCYSEGRSQNRKIKKFLKFFLLASILGLPVSPGFFIHFSLISSVEIFEKTFLLYPLILLSTIKWSLLPYLYNKKL